jgi:hypothetical protein
MASVSNQAPALPPRGRTWLFIGQDLDSVAAYRTRVCPSSHETTYGDLLEGKQPKSLTQTVDVRAGRLNAGTSAARSKRVALGIYMVDNARKIAEKKCDPQIDAYLHLMKSHPSTHFLMRIGYEFDGPWNRYPPGDYRQAFRRIVERWRKTNVSNFSAVWQSCAYDPATTEAGLGEYYPGDAFVDWVGLSYFSAEKRPAQDSVLAFARTHGKPVMICEAAPQGYQIDELSRAPVTGPPTRKTGLSAEALWQEWYAPFFEWIHRHGDQIRAVAYINADWDNQKMWGPESGYRQGYWGDSRVEGNEFIRTRWLEETGTGFWVR